MILSKPSVARPLVVCALALLTCGAFYAVASAAEPPPPPIAPPPAASASKGYLTGKGGQGLAPVSGKTEEDACRKDGNAVVTRDGKTFCGKALDAAGETACAKEGGKVVAIATKKYCEMPQPSASPTPVTPPAPKGAN